MDQKLRPVAPSQVLLSEKVSLDSNNFNSNLESL
jgi:hypothetical protein